MTAGVRLIPCLVFALLVGIARPAAAERTLVAVAANFTVAAQDIAAAFQRTTGHEAVLAFGATGRLYAQIVHGAPFEVFLAADEATPRRTIEEGLAVAGSGFTYAVGRLVLYSRDAALVDDRAAVLHPPLRFEHLAIANPDTAPYGAAALEALHALGVHEAVSPRLVRGDSIAQTLQFVVSGSAPLGFVALSQLADVSGGSRWLVPQSLHAPIRQDAVLLKTGAGRPAAQAFLEFLRGDAARALAARYGYAREDRE